MEQRIVDKRFINSLRLHSINTSSILYINKEDLIKAPYYDKDWWLCQGRPNVSDMEKALDCLEVLDGDYYILPKYSLYTSSIKTPNYKGYGMDYVKDYKNMSESIENNNYTHKEKLEICRRICDAITKLERYKIAYWDIHSDNILINKDKKIKICDMDSVSPLSLYGELEYKKDLLWSYKYLTSLVLAILYGIDEMSLSWYIENSSDVRFIKESPMFQTVISEDCYMFYPGEHLDEFTEDYVEETKLILKKDNF